MKKIDSIFVLLLCFVWLFYPYIADYIFGENAAYSNMGALCVQKEGRNMPLSSAANDALRMLSGKSTVVVDGKKVSATEYVLMLNAQLPQAYNANVFRIDDLDLRKALNLKSRYASYNLLKENAQKLANNAAFLNLAQNVLAFETLGETFVYSPDNAEFAPSKFFAYWQNEVASSQREILQARTQNRKVDDSKIYNAGKILALLREKQAIFNSQKDFSFKPLYVENRPVGAFDFLLERNPDALSKKINSAYCKYFEALNAGNIASAAKLKQQFLAQSPFKIRFEDFANKLDIFYKAFVLFCAAAICGLLSRLGGGKKGFFYTAFITTAMTATLFCCFALAIRCYIQLRPPITNLYSSAVFTGTVCALVSMVLWCVKRNSIYAFAGCIIGAISSLVAVNLPYSGDTMGQMRAVLNSNFYLTVHVVVIMLGYCAALLAASIASLRLIGNAVSLKKSSKEQTAKCVVVVAAIMRWALLFVFAGTMLGGVWADFSWGRFWGWDPKENGALILLLYLAVCVHCKSFALVGNRAFLGMASLTTVAVVWAWFGVNMLGIGLHSYGFFSGNWFAFLWVVAVQILVAALCKIRERND